MTDSTKRQTLHDIEDITRLPDGQLRAVVGLLGGDEARTYRVASQFAGMSLGTLYTHLRRIRRNHPKLYDAIHKVRKAQLRQRHRDAVARAREHSRQYFRNLRKHNAYIYRLMFGIHRR